MLFWAGAALGLLIGTTFGVLIMCAFNLASVNDRAMAAACRALELTIALRRLLVAAQGYTETGDGFDILAVAMSNAAEVLGA